MGNSKKSFDNQNSNISLYNKNSKSFDIKNTKSLDNKNTKSLDNKNSIDYSEKIQKKLKIILILK